MPKLFKRKQPAGRASPGVTNKPPVFSYYNSRSRSDTGVGREPTTEPDAPRRRNTNQIVWLPTYIAGLAIMLCALYASTLSITPKIVPDAAKSPNVLQASSVYQRSASDILDNSLLSRSKVAINTNSIAKQLRERHPELKAVSVTVPISGREPIIIIQPVEPVLILATTSGMYVVDEDGRAVLKADQLPDAMRSRLTTIIDDTGLTVELGKRVLPLKTLNFLYELQAQLQTKQVGINSLTLPTVTNEVHLRITGEQYYIKFNVEGDARLQSGALLAIREKLQAEGKTPAEYIDVRLEDRVFYK